MKTTSQEGGFTLIECLTYIAVLTIITGLAFSAYHRCQRNSVALKRNAEDIIQTLSAGERWRTDIRAATARPQLIEKKTVAELHIPQSPRPVVYYFKDSAVWRKVGEKGTSQRLLSGIRGSRMLLDQGAQVVSWRWEVELQSSRKEVRIRPLFTFQSVTGCNP